jgi:thiosulfate sulfurtransferase
VDIPEIEVTEARGLLETGEAVFVDIRDPHSHESLRVPGSVHLDDSTVGTFVESADKEAAIVVYCYHGHSSLGATVFLLERGFRQVASLAGGFAAWQASGAPQAHGPHGRPVGG